MFVRRDGVDAVMIKVCERLNGRAKRARAFESQVATFQSLYQCETVQTVSFVSDYRSKQQVIRQPTTSNLENYTRAHFKLNFFC